MASNLASSDSLLLPELLEKRATEQGASLAYTFLLDGDEAAEQLTWVDLHRRAGGIAAVLGQQMKPGERALLLFPPGLDFIAAFFGCLYAGVVAVPAYPPRPRKDDRLEALATDSKPKLVLTTSALAGRVSKAAARVVALSGVPLLAVDTLPLSDASVRPVKAVPGDTAFLQYTSGSTSTPKGVMVSHGNLVHNEAMIQQAFGQDEESVVVGWLPLYHDMGLIGNVLQPLFVGGSCVLMSPVAFLQRPLRWLRAISRFRATTSGGPNFAYDLCVRRISEADRRELDLSSWRLAYNGAEPVRADTLRRFAEAFGPSGFDARSFFPCYGLAEGTLFAAGPRRGEETTVAWFDEAALAEHRAVPVTEEVGGRCLVSCGGAWMGQRLILVDPETGREVPPGMVGEIWLSGESIAAGYWQRPEVNAETFGALLANGSGPFLRTGDLGFLDPTGSELFVTGRLKDLIILRGRNHYPQDLELTASRSHPDLLPDGGAAFAVVVEGEERLVVVHEVERRAEDHGAIFEAVRRCIAEEHEARVHEVVLIRRSTLLKTSSGKVRRRACRAAYLEGGLRVVAASGVAEAVPRGAAGDLPRRGELFALPRAERRTAVVEALRTRAAGLLGLEIDSLRPGVPLTALGLDSLAAIELKGSVEESLGLELPLADLLAGCSLEDLADRVAEALEEGPKERVSEAGAEGVDTHSPSPGQEALWFLERLSPTAAIYNIAVAARWLGGGDAEALERALEDLAGRHELLRATFPARDGGPALHLDASMAVDFAELETSEQGLDDLLTAEAHRPFELAKGPLCRLRLVRGAREPVVLFVIHHLIADFASLAVLGEELGKLYREHSGGGAAALAEPGASYGIWARRRRERLSGARVKALWAYWGERLAGPPPDLDLPTDHPRPAVRSGRGGGCSTSLPATLARSLEELARSRGCTVFTVLLAAWQVQLSRATGQRDFAVGAPTAGRDGPRLARTVGYYVQPVVLRSDLANLGDSTNSFDALLERVRGTVNGALGHAELPLAALAERLRPGRDLSRSPLFQTMLVLQAPRPGDDPSFGAFALGTDGIRLQVGGMVLESLALTERRAQLDLTLHAAPWPAGGLGLLLEYDAELFESTTIARMLHRFETLLHHVVVAPETAVDDLQLLSAPERSQLLVQWNDLAEPPGVEGQCLHHLFRVQAERTPSACALVAGDERLSYGELARRVWGLAGTLRSLGVGPEVRVGVCLERTAEMVVSLLAVLEAGGAYVALDPAYPRERLDFLLADADAALVLTSGAAKNVLDGAAARMVDVGALDLSSAELEQEALDSGARGENLAYVLYTSGSTGRPKGVAIPHRGAVMLVRWARTVYGDEALSGMLAATSINFDLSVFELFMPLAWGGRVVLVPNALALPDLAAREEVRLLNTVPSALAELLRQGPLPSSVTTVNLAGEPIDAALLAALEALAPAVRSYNLYGPSEDTTYSTFARLDPGVGAPIGRPLPGTRALLVDRRLRPVGVGQLGELLLGGAGLARGYLRQPGLTAERFVPDFGGPDSGARLYRTGDLARHRGDGTLDFLGRLDHQVKVRGFRIELGEIEAQLVRHEQVEEVVVVAAPEPSGGGWRLVAYVAPVEGAVDLVPVLRQHLGQHLPGYMMPGVWEVLEALPRTPNGKVDRRALPAPEEDGAAEPAQPSTPTEEILAGCFAELLGRERVGVGDNFFELGGHSLLALRLVSRCRQALGVELPVQEIFEAPTVEALARRVEEARGVQPPPPIPVAMLPPGKDPLRREPSFAQERLWFLHQLDPSSTAYNMPAAVHLRGNLDLDALGLALARVVARNGALRTTFELGPEGPRQVIHRGPVPVHLPRVDLSGLDPSMRLKQAHRLAHAEARRAFDLVEGPLFRVMLLELERGRDALLVFTLHHVAGDGWTLGLLGQELGRFYAGQESPASTVGYWDFATWQRRRLAPSGGVLERELAFWRERLDPPPAVLELPLDRARSATRKDAGTCHRFALPAELSREVEALARRLGATPFMALFAFFQALLYRLSGQGDFAVGVPVAGREAPDTEGIFGVFVNTLVLRTPENLGHGMSPGRLVASARQAVLAAAAHQELPFEKLVEELSPRRDLGSSPFFQVMCALQPTPMASLSLPGVELKPIPLDSGAARFDLTLFLSLESEGIDCGLEYAHQLFDGTTVKRLAGHFERLVRGAVENPEGPLGALSLLGASARQQLVVEWNDTATDFPSGDCLHQLFQAQAIRTPEAQALVVGEERFTYRWLDERSRSLAQHLRTLGVGPETRVGVCLGRDADLVVSLLAVLAAGGAYVALDPTYPRRRLELLLEDSGARLVLARQRPPALADAAVQWVDPTAPQAEGEVSPCTVGPHNLAYVLYTSGSTGKPKGVAITHRSAVVLVQWGRRIFGDSELEGVLAATSINFDLSVFELFVPLAWGGRVLLAENALELATMGARDEVTLVNTVPSAMAELVRADALPTSLRTVNLAGEPIPPPLVTALLERLPPGGRLLNLYGPSEDTTYSTFLRLEESGSVPIGRPLADTRVHLLDAGGNTVSTGVAGELCLGGAGLARGYLDRPALTAERFVPDVSGAPGERLYRTGDLARWRGDGTLLFLGRRDHQVKVRGFRIELGEVEAALYDLVEVREAAVLAVADGSASGHRLVAWVVPKGEPEGWPGSLAEALESRLPGPLVPELWGRLEALPLSPNGKVDRGALARRALPETEVASTAGEAPRGPLEELVAEAFRELLGRGVGRGESFFELGGHSLLAMRLVTRLRSATGRELAVRSVFEAPTVAALAARLEEGSGADVQRTIERLPRPLEQAVQSFAQERLFFLYRLDPESPAYNLPLAVDLGGALEVPILAGALVALARRHSSLRTTFALGDGAVQLLAPADEASVPLAVVDLEALLPERRAAVTTTLLWQLAQRPFDLADGPLLRAVLLRHRGEEHRLFLDLHHIVADGWSLGVLARELEELYAAGLGSRRATLEPLDLHYADFAAWQRRFLEEGGAEAELDFWRQRLDLAPQVLELPADRARPAVQSLAGATFSSTLPAEVESALQKLGQDFGTTLFMTLLAAFQALLARTSGQRNFAVGTPVAGREAVESEALIGLFVNTLVLRAELESHSLASLLPEVREETLAAFAHRELPFEKLVEELAPDRDLARTPLFQTLFVLQNTPPAVPRLAGLEATRVPVDSGTAKFDLTLFAVPGDGGLELLWEYNRDLFDATTLGRLDRRFVRLLRAVTEQPEIPLFELPLLAPAEWQQVLWEWNDTATGPVPEDLLHGLFYAAAAEQSEALAVTAGDRHLSYGTLASRATEIARQLRGMGVGPEVRVGVFLRRSPEMVVALLAILTAGGAYVGLDPAYPEERLAFMVEDARIEVLVSEPELRGKLPVPAEGVVELVARAPEPGEPVEEWAMAGQLAYLIYTSGSTGRPKGVAIEHRAVAGLMHWARPLFERGLAGLVAATSICFDLSIFELFTPLSWGGRVLLVDDVLALAEPPAWRRAVRLVNTVPSAMAELLANAPPEGSTVVLAGEPLGAGLVEQLYASGAEGVWNLYGPSEDTTYSTGLRIPPGTERVTIGRPLADKWAYLLDRPLAARAPRGGGGAISRRRRPGSGIFGTTFAHGGELCAGSPGGWFRGASLPHRRPGSSSGGWRNRFSGPHRPPGEGAGFPHRIGGDRSLALTPWGSGGSGGGGPGGELGGPRGGGRSGGCGRPAPSPVYRATGIHGTFGFCFSRKAAEIATMARWTAAPWRPTSRRPRRLWPMWPREPPPKRGSRRSGGKCSAVVRWGWRRASLPAVDIRCWRCGWWG